MPGSVVLRGDRVTLRTIDESDFDFLQRARANPELRYPMGNPTPRSRSSMEPAPDEDGTARFIVTLDGPDVGPGPVGRDGGGRVDADAVERLGWTAVENADWRRPEVSYWLAPEAQGEGYGKEAIALTVEFAFREYDRPAVAAQVYDHNEASRGVLESLGFELEGRLRKDRYIDGAYRDTCWYGLLRSEWDGRD